MSYLSQPAISRSHLYFISEEDLWSVPLTDIHGHASRMTAGLGPLASPKVSPDGKWIALASEEEGHCEVYVMPANGGELKRLTYMAGWSYPIAWKDNGTILFKSNAEHAHRMQEFFEISREGGLPIALCFGEGSNLDFESQHGFVIERNMHRPDASHWKRYRGGTMGQLWVGKDADASFQKLRELPGNLSCPHWLNGRIFYLSDETGFGRIYSCNAEGQDKKAHGTSFKSDYYFRNLETNRELMVFQSAGELYLFDAKVDSIQKVFASVTSDRSKAKRKNINPAPIITDFSLQPQGEKLLVEARGRVMTFAHWTGPVNVIGKEAGIRYKHGDWLIDGKRVVVVKDDGLTESLELFTERGEWLKSILPSKTLSQGYGRIMKLKTSPRLDEIAIANHRNELIHVDVATGEGRLVHQNEHQVLEDFNWSPDGRYLTFAESKNNHSTYISMWDKQDGVTRRISEGTFQDYSPCFDPEGRYLYFLSKRVFNPVYDDVLFGMSFPKAGIPLLVVLKKGMPSPFMVETALPDSLAKNPILAKPVSEVMMDIDFDGIHERIVQFPIQEAKYTKIVGANRKVLWSYIPVEGTLTPEPPTGSPIVGKEFLDCFDFHTRKFEYYGTGVTAFKIRHEANLKVVRIGNTLRLSKGNEKADENSARDLPSPKNGTIDLTRLSLMVEPESEWMQMYRDSWRMQKEYFWREDMNGVNWDEMYRRYEPVIEKVNCRREYSDVIWELIGELGTSHAYDRGGDYRGVPIFAVGSLGAKFSWNAKANAYEIQKIYRGDFWSKDSASPLSTPGAALKEGDFLREVGGVVLSEILGPQEACLNFAGKEIWIRFQRKNENESKDAIIRLSKNDQPLHYRDWVESKRALVKKLSNGRLGYVHIPNMVGQGYAEFHRSFMEELECEGLVIDVRFNGGGHVSQLLIDLLSRRPIGKAITRWFGEGSVPHETTKKVAIAVCNEFAGSDGDIFSHSFKLKKIGKLVGTRTWGGVVGIWPRNTMIDGGFTTQPEFAHSFNDVGLKLENHGADPDRIVEFPPEAHRKGEDPQIAFAVKEAMRDL